MKQGYFTYCRNTLKDLKGKAHVARALGMECVTFWTICKGKVAMKVDLLEQLVLLGVLKSPQQWAVDHFKDELDGPRRS